MVAENNKTMGLTYSRTFSSIRETNTGHFQMLVSITETFGIVVSSGNHNKMPEAEGQEDPSSANRFFTVWILRSTCQHIRHPLRPASLACRWQRPPCILTWSFLSVCVHWLLFLVWYYFLSLVLFNFVCLTVWQAGLELAIFHIL